MASQEELQRMGDEELLELSAAASEVYGTRQLLRELPNRITQLLDEFEQAGGDRVSLLAELTHPSDDEPEDPEISEPPVELEQ